MYIHGRELALDEVISFGDHTIVGIDRRLGLALPDALMPKATVIKYTEHRRRTICGVWTAGVLKYAHAEHGVVIEPCRDAQSAKARMHYLIEVEPTERASA